MEKSIYSPVKFDAQGRLLIPKRLRDALSRGNVTEFVAKVQDGRLILEPKSFVLQGLQARYAGIDESLAESLIKDCRQEAFKED